MDQMIQQPKPKSTGERSQNNHVWGHCRDIAQQFCERGKRVDAVDVLLAVRWSLVEENEWELVEVFGRFLPAPWSEADSEHANMAVEICHAWAAKEQMWLTEYINGVATKTWTGL